jgi:hypothetical protein
VAGEPDLAGLEAERARLYAGLSGVGDFRRGTLSAVFRKCGKPNCRCARPGERGHGPQWNWIRWAGGKTVTAHPRPGPELDKAQREAGELERFRSLTRISAPPLRPLGQVNSKRSWRPSHQGTVVLAGRLACRRTGE